MTTEPAPAPMPPERPHLLEDMQRLSKYAALAGAGLAVLCHLLPPHYRTLCDALAALCKGTP